MSERAHLGSYLLFFSGARVSAEHFHVWSRAAEKQKAEISVSAVLYTGNS
jgi:hypothetical protein